MIPVKVIVAATDRSAVCGWGKIIHQDLGLERRAHQHEPQVGSQGQQIPQSNQQKFRVLVPFVNLVDDNMGVLGEHWRGLQLPQKDPRCQKQELGVPAVGRFEPHLVADQGSYTTRAI